VTARRSASIPHDEWFPTSHASVPVVYQPHPPKPFSGRYRDSVTEMPVRPRIGTRVRKSVRLAVGLSVVLGPLGLWYLSAGAGLAATVLAVVAVGTVGLSALLLVWPLSIAATVWWVRRAGTGTVSAGQRSSRLASRSK
jgi:hypothetical protein